MYIVLVLSNHKQVIIDSFKHCTSTIMTDGSQDLLFVAQCPTGTCAACLDRVKGLYYIALQERQDWHVHILQKSDHICPQFGKN